MKYAFLSLDFRRFDLETAFRCAKEYGFDGLEIWGGRPHAWPLDHPARKAAQINRLKAAYGLEIPMFTPSALGNGYRLTVADADERKDAMKLLKAAIDLSSAIGSPRLLVTADHPGYNVSYADAWKIFCDNISALCDYGRERGVRIVVEPLTPMESPLIVRTDDCVRLLDAVGHENLYFMMDVCPPLVAYEPFSDYFTKLGKRMDYIHICNNDGITDAHVRLENGVIPIRDMFTIFRKYGYDGYVSAELYTELYHDPELLIANTSRILHEIKEMGT